MVHVDTTKNLYVVIQRYAPADIKYCFFNIWTKLTRNKNARHIFPHHFFPVAMIGIISLHMHFVLYVHLIRDQYFSNTYTTSGYMTITAQNARARRALQPRGFSKQKIVFDIASFIY